MSQVVIFVFLPDVQSAVSGLIDNDLDFIDRTTLGAGVEVQTVIDTALRTGELRYAVIASPTWEHLDINVLR